MDFIYAALEKIISSLLLSFVLFVASFSYMTGQFPPRKDDLNKVWTVGKTLILGSQGFNEQTQSLAVQKDPSLDQILEYQRLALKRTEMAIELKKLFSRIPSQAPSPQIAAKVMKIQEQFGALETQMNELGADIQKQLEAQ